MPANDYASLYESAGKQYGVDPHLLQAVIHVESRGNPNATSPVGAQGVAQLMPATAKGLGVKNAFDPNEAIPAAAKLLSENYTRYGDVNKAVLAYHGGTDEKNWGPKTKAYLQSVSEAYGTQPQGAQDSHGMNTADLDALIIGNGQVSSKPSVVSGGLKDADIDALISGVDTPSISDSPSAVKPKTAASPAAKSSPTIDLKAIFGLRPEDKASADSTRNNFLGQQQEGQRHGLTRFGQGVTDVAGTMGMPLAYAEQALGGQPFSQYRENMNAYNQRIDNKLGPASMSDNASRIIGQTVTMAPAMALAGQGVAASARALGNVIPAVEPTVNALVQGVQRLGPDASTALRIGNALLRYGVGGARGAAQGGTAAALTSGASDQPILNQIEQGAKLGGALGVAAPVARDVGRTVGNFGRGLVAPFTKSGQERIANETIERFAGGPVTVNASEIVPGSRPTMGELDPRVAGLQRGVQNINPNPFAERAQANASARNALFEDVAGLPGDIPVAAEARGDSALPKLEAAFKGAGEADPKYVRQTINKILASPAGQRDAVSNALLKVRDKLEMDYPLSERVSDALAPIKNELSVSTTGAAKREALGEARRLLNSANRGFTTEEDLVKGLSDLAKTQKSVGPIDNALTVIKSGGTRLESDPAQLYGIRQSITDMLSPLASGTDSSARLAAKQLSTITESLDNAIEKAAPGYKDYMQTYASMSKPIDQMKLLQGLKLTDQFGNITLSKVQSAIKKISADATAPGAKAAKNLSEEQLRALSAIRDDLLRGANTSFGKAIGSNTVQNLATDFALSNTLPGGLGRTVGNITPTAVGAGIGGTIGSIGGPATAAAGATAGGYLGNVAGNVYRGALSRADQAILENVQNRLLNPSIYNPVQRGTGPVNALLNGKAGQALRSYAIPLAVTSNRLRSSASR